MTACISNTMSGRGRGKRVAVKNTDVGAQALAPGQALAQGQAPGQTQVPEEKPVKKTSKKKQFPVVAVITPDGIEGTLLPEARRPLIVHLPIQSKDVFMNDMPITYNPRPPTEAEPYDINADNPFYDDVEHLPTALGNDAVLPRAHSEQINMNIAATNTLDSSVSAPNVAAAGGAVADTEIDYYTLKSNLLVQFKESADVKSIPRTSEVSCFWCCHSFTNRPVVLPIRDTGEYLQVTGNFCSPECACAYLFDIRQDSHTRWEQLALLYRVYGEACQGKIHPAPSRQILKQFGGNLSIQEYRALIRSQSVRVDIHLPPMVSILATMDTKPIDFYDSSLTKGVTETVKERLQKAEEVLRLRRTKPLKAWESTLDACLNLKIKNEGTTCSVFE